MEETQNKVNRKPGFTLIYLLGVATVIGGQVSYWNEGLSHGLWPLFGSFLLMLSGYICLALCLCEMTAALPFSGGTYGLARVTLGQFAGYLMASFEMVEYVIYVVLIAHSIGEMVTEITGRHRQWEPITWIAFYLSGFVFQLSKPIITWSFVAFFGSCILIYFVVFIVVAPATAHANFNRYAVNHNQQHETATNCVMGWFKCIPFSSWFFLGIETLPIASGDIFQANRTIPRAIIVLLITVVVTAVPIMFAASSIFPGAVSTAFQQADSPLNYGYTAMMGITHHQALISTLIVKYITGFGFMFAYGRQISAMQLSGLILTQLRITMGDKNVFRRGLIAAAIVSLVFLTATWLFNNNFFRHFHSACLLGNYLVCLGICLSYIQFRAKYDSLAKTNRSALGVCGAIYGIVVFTIAFVSLAGFQNDNGMALLTLALFTVYMLIRYLIFNMGKPVISTEEQSVLFVLYVINANMNRKRIINERALSRARDHQDSDSSIARTHSNSVTMHSPGGKKRNNFRNSLTFYLSGRHQPHSSDADTSAPSTRNPSYRTAATGSDKEKNSSRIHSGRVLTASEIAVNTAADSVTYFHEAENDLIFEQSLTGELTLRRTSSKNTGFHRQISGDHAQLFDVEEEDSDSTNGSSVRVTRQSFPASDNAHGGDIEMSSTHSPLSAGKTRRGSGNKRGTMEQLTIPKFAGRKLSADYSAMSGSSDTMTVDSRLAADHFLTPDMADIPYTGRQRPSLRSFSGGDALLAIGEEGPDMGRMAGDRPHSHRMKPQPHAQSITSMGRYSVASDSPDMHDGVIISGVQQSLSLDTHLPVTDRQHQLQQQSPPPRRGSRGTNSRFKAFNQRVFGAAPTRMPVMVSTVRTAQQQRTRVSSLDATILDMYHDEVQEYYSHNHEVEEDGEE